MDQKIIGKSIFRKFYYKIKKYYKRSLSYLLNDISEKDINLFISMNYNTF